MSIPLITVFNIGLLIKGQHWIEDFTTSFHGHSVKKFVFSRRKAKNGIIFSVSNSSGVFKYIGKDVLSLLSPLLVEKWNLNEKNFGCF